MEPEAESTVRGTPSGSKVSRLGQCAYIPKSTLIYNEFHASHTAGMEFVVVMGTDGFPAGGDAQPSGGGGRQQMTNQ